MTKLQKAYLRWVVRTIFAGKCTDTERTFIRYFPKSVEIWRLTREIPTALRMPDNSTKATELTADDFTTRKTFTLQDFPEPKDILHVARYSGLRIDSMRVSFEEHWVKRHPYEEVQILHIFHSKEAGVAGSTVGLILDAEVYHNV